jgi:hypothetical protein
MSKAHDTMSEGLATLFRSLFGGGAAPETPTPAPGPGPMESFEQNFDYAGAPTPPASNNILDFSPRAFRDALDELRLPEEERLRLEQMYRERSSPFAGDYGRLDARREADETEGMRRGMLAPMRWPEGMTGFEALRSGDWEFARPGMVGDVADALMRAADTPGLLLRGVPMQQDEVEDAALVAGEMALTGAFVPRPRPGAPSRGPDSPDALPPATAAEARLEELIEWDMQSREMARSQARGEPPGEPNDWMRDMDRRVGLGEFDDLLPETQLRRDLERMFFEDVNGLLTPQALRADGFSDADIAALSNRYEALQNRFPDTVNELWGQPVTPLPPPPAQITLDPGPAQGAPDPWRNVGPDPQVLPWQQRLGLPDDAPVVRSQAETASPYLYRTPTTQQPLTWGEQGLAGLYSRSTRAADNLRQPVYTDLGQLRKELEARGAPDRDLTWQLRPVEDLFTARPGPDGQLVPARVTREQIQEALRGAPGLNVTRTSSYATGHMVPGGQNGTTTLYHHPGAHSGPSQGYRHFGGPGRTPEGQFSDRAPLFHTRAAQYDITTPTGEIARTHHVAEIQSDWAQHRQLLPANDARMQAMQSELNQLRNQPLPADEAGLAAAFSRMERLEEALGPGLTREQFDARYPAPFVRNTDHWVEAGVRQNLLDAANGGSEWITFGNGRQANQHTFMPIDAARQFYDATVPSAVERVLKTFARDAGIPVPQLVELPFVDGQVVRGVQITPELRQALIERGLPQFRDGGMVNAGGLAPLAGAETIEAHEPSLRDRIRQALSGVIGQDTAGRIAGSRENIGLLDMTPMGVPFALQEGTRDAVAGARSGDAVGAALGAGEALLAITPIPGPAVRGARTMAPAGGRRGGGGSREQDNINLPGDTRPSLFPHRSTPDAQTDYRFERVWDPDLGREVTRIEQRVSGAQASASRRATTRPRRAAPEAGGETIAPAAGDNTPRPRYVRDPASGQQYDMMGAGPDPTPTRAPTFTERLAATDGAFPTEFPRVRLPAVGTGTLAPSAPSATFAPSNVDMMNSGAMTGRAYREAQTGAPGRRIAPEDVAGDPSNEWLQVPVTALERIGLRPQQLTDPTSRLSPDGATAYLGPTDVSRFLTVWNAPSRQLSDPLPAPTLLPPRPLSDASVLGYPRAAAPGQSFDEMRQQARSGVQRDTNPRPPNPRGFRDPP